MNRAGYALRCVVCDLDFYELLFETGSYSARPEIHRQMSNGICDEDQRRRQAAAVEFERASYAVRLITDMGAVWAGYPAKLPSALLEAGKRLSAADRECVRLKMWPATERNRK